MNGFKCNKSTIINLLSFLIYVFNVLLDGSNVGIIHTNFTKAFGRIIHQILITKLEQIDICKFVLSWYFFLFLNINLTFLLILFSIDQTKSWALFTKIVFDFSDKHIMKSLHCSLVVYFLLNNKVRSK